MRFSTISWVVAAGILMGMACSRDEDSFTGPGETDPSFRDPPTSLGAFPAGPNFPVVGDVYKYRLERFFYSSGSDSSADSSHFGDVTVKVDSLVPFGGFWPRAYRISRIERVVNTDETAETELEWVQWQIRSEVKDVSVEIADVGALGPAGGPADVFAEPRMHLHFPLSPDTTGEIGAWVDGSTSVTRHHLGRSDLEVDFNLVPTDPVKGTYETYLVVDSVYSATGSGVVKRWWGEVGLVREVTIARLGASRVETEVELYEFRPAAGD